MIGSETDTQMHAAQGVSTIRVELPAEPVSIAVARSVIRRAVTFVDDDARSSFLVALTEILANAIDEHERTGVDQPISLIVEYGPTDTVRVIDHGAGFEDSTTGSGVSTTEERGRGLALARAFVEGLVIESSVRGTSVTLPLAGMGIVR